MKKRVVVKIGSSSLTDTQGGLSNEKLREHVNALAWLKKQNHDVVLITSGAVAAGFTQLGYPARPVTVSGKQAASAVGQGLLMESYTEELKKHGIVTAQLLLTRHSFLNKHQYKNVNATLTELLKRDVLPIINENDSVSIDELTFGDNDMLSALVSGLVHAKFLIMLTDINGIYDKNPHRYPDAKRYHFLPEVTDELVTVASGTKSKVGTGGMTSKIEAARTALSLGVQVFIGMGTGVTKLADILDGKGDGTYIGNANQALLNNAKQWLALHSNTSGRIEVDTGAEMAILQRGKSLLPVGITSIVGHFSADDVVEVVNHKGDVIGKGQVCFSSDELEQIKGRSSKEAMAIANRNQQVVIHRDNWVSKIGKEIKK